MKVLIPVTMTLLAARTLLVTTLGVRGCLVQAVENTSCWGFLKTKRTSQTHHLFRGGAATDATTDPTAAAAAEKRTTKIYRTLQVQIVHRHGDRTPITPLKDEEYWAKTLIPPDLLKKIASNTQVLTPPGGELHHAAKGRGPFGKLTQLGLFQLVDLGTRLREELVSKDHHADDLQAYTTIETETDDDSDNDKSLYFRYPWHAKRPLHPTNIKVLSTNFPRTIQSAQGLLVGLFPDGWTDSHHHVIDIDARHTDILIPDPQPRTSVEQERLEAELAAQPHFKDKEEEMRPLAIQTTQALMDFLGDGALDVSYGVGEEEETNDNDNNDNKRLAWGQLAEITKCLLVRNKLPPAITPHHQDAISNYTAWRWFESLRHPRLAFLAMNPLVSRLVSAMERHHEEPPVIIYSAHDSTLIGLLCGFRLEQPSVWPEYASYLKIELLEVVSTSTVHENNNNHDGSKAAAVPAADMEKEYVVRFSLNGNLLRSIWDKEQPPLKEIPLQLLARKIKTEGSVTTA